MLNLPQKVTMSNNRFVKYKYSATGDKLQAIYSVSGLKLIQPMSEVMSDRSGNDDTLSSSDINLGASLYDSFADPSTSGSSQNIYGLPVLDYCGNIVYSDKEPVKILFDGGYVTIKKGVPTYHFFLRDHLGNVRVVADANGKLEERNDYYPFGGLMGKGLNGDFQSYKYNGKELERQIGLDIYDYGARRYDAATCRFTTMDPLAEKYYSTSPYAYCVNNPMRFVDTDGKKIKDPDGIVKNYKNQLSDNINNLQEMINISAVESGIGGELMSLYKTALEEISKLEDSDQVYTIFSDKSSKEGGMSYNMVSGEVKIGLGDNNIGIVGHELIHAYQYEEGKVSLFVDNSGYGQLYDITDETKAYNRERALGTGIQFFQTPKIVVDGYPLQMSDRDVKTFGNSMSSPAYQTLPSRSIDIKSKTGKMLRLQTKQAGSLGILIKEVYKGWQKDYQKGQKK